MLPGRTLQRFARFVLPAHVCDQIIEAQVADFQHEWSLADSFASHLAVLVRGYSAFMWSCVLCLVAGGREPATPNDRRALVRVIAISSLATVAMLALLSLPAFSNNPVPVHASAERMAS